MNAVEDGGWKMENCQKGWSAGFGNPFIYLLFSILVFTLGCRREMFDQPRAKPLRSSDFFSDRAASRSLPQNTVARGFLFDDEALYSGAIGTNLIMDFPLPMTREVLERGRERFEIYCAACHGRTGQ